MAAMLKVNDIHVYYGKIHAVKGVSFEVNEGEIVSIIGANGAGKSTILKTVSGLMHPKSGTIEFMGKDIAHMEPNKIVTKGLVHVPEGRRVFAHMSVMENIEMGAYILGKAPEEAVEDVFTRFPRLKERRKQEAGTLSGGEQQMLAMARALMSKPKLIMMDEPSMGLSPIMTREVFAVLRALKDEGTTIFLIEQNAFEALELTDRAYIMESGRITLEGRSSDLLNDERVKNAYLGGDV